MTYGTFMATVRERGEYAADEAERLVQAVIATLGERLPEPSAEHLADQLPIPLADLVDRAAGPARTWGVSEFINQVAEHTEQDEESAEEDTRVVFSVLADQISGGEMNKLISQLPSGYADLFGHAELS
ncbi:DUF2267 domain-containing protein [Streptomyces sp. DSM 44915]|uniref:DUF2267 domain-containing protein n=1 Tax=Streptomyces chisholmiae TaxID=3075540 RepID=A0ABU2JN96_9ACTN|nr:DUF2267 domain-containing protein [Streptomyces sp. DSM 44915]MDT0266459.1 DUF2267 domain-containing protein [Streptomyces sp. DSM 44915]